MKLSSAIWRSLLVFLAVCTIQSGAGTLLLSNIKMPAAPHFMQWMLLANSLVVASLAFVAYRSDLRGWRLGVTMAAIPFVIACVNLVEAVVFLTGFPMQWARLFGYFLVSAVLVMPVWMLLFGKRSSLSPEHFQPIVSKPLGERIWKFVVSDIAYCFLYLTAGMIIFPWVKDFYATQHIPPMTTIVELQLLLRGPIFILMCLALVRMLGLPRLGGALAVGAVFTIVSGIAPLLTPNAFFPDIVRWAHLCEVTSSNFLFGAIVAWLWGRPTFAHAPALHQAA